MFYLKYNQHNANLIIPQAWSESSVSSTIPWESVLPSDTDYTNLTSRLSVKYDKRVINSKYQRIDILSDLNNILDSSTHHGYFVGMYS